MPNEMAMAVPNSRNPRAESGPIQAVPADSQRWRVFAGPQNGTEPIGTRIANRVELPYFLLDVVRDSSNSYGSIVIHDIRSTRIAIIRETHAAAVCHNEAPKPTNERSMYVAIYHRLGAQRAEHGDQFRIR